MSIEPTPPPMNIIQRLWTYQAERFPMRQHAALIAVFSVSAVCFSAVMRGGWPRVDAIVVGFIGAFLFFLQLRLADEFEDYEEDVQLRPHHPVSRGVVSLRDLEILGAVTVGMQLVFTVWLSWWLLLVLAMTWGYLYLTSQDFFRPAWFKQYPAVYTLTQLLIMPFIALYVTAADWLVAWDPISVLGLTGFLLVTFFNGLVLEIGRKIRAPEQEEPGVETYSAKWGHLWATLALGGALLLTTISAGLAAQAIGFITPVVILLVGLLLIAGVMGEQFITQPTPRHAQRLELMVSIWTVVMYLSLGVVPLLVSNL